MNGRSGGHFRTLLAFLIMATCSHSARAEDDTRLCKAIAAEANHVGHQFGEQDIAAISAKLAQVLPPGISYLKPTDLSTEDFRRLLGCGDDQCSSSSDETIQTMIENDEGMNWYKHLVDTRPWSNSIIVFTDHSMHHRADYLVALRPLADGTVDIVTSFPGPDGICCDRSFELLRSGSELKVALPPSYEFFREEASSVHGRDRHITMTLDLYGDPSKPQQQSGPSCSVAYDLIARLGLDKNVPAPLALDGRAESSVDRQLDAMAARFSLGEDEGALQFADAKDFVEPKASSEDFVDVRSFLVSQDFASNLTYDAVKLLAATNVEPWTGDESNVESRWFPMSVDKHVYAALLMRQRQELEGPFLALFRIDHGKPALFAAYPLTNFYRFAGAKPVSGHAE